MLKIKIVKTKRSIHLRLNSFLGSAPGLESLHSENTSLTRHLFFLQGLFWIFQNLSAHLDQGVGDVQPGLDGSLNLLRNALNKSRRVTRFT